MGSIKTFTVFFYTDEKQPYDIQEYATYLNLSQASRMADAMVSDGEAVEAWVETNFPD